jgi:membrane fusion protein
VPRTAAQSAKPPPAAVEPAAKAPAPEKLFRREALDAQYGSNEPRTSLPQPTGSNWGILAVVASLVLVLFVGALFASVEVTVKAPGALRAPEGLRPVESAIGGAIAEVRVHAGDEVSAGQLIAKLAVAQLDASLTSKRQELEALKQQNALGEASDKAYAQRIDTALQRRRRVLQSRSQLNQELRAQRRDLLDRTHEAVREGVGSLNQELASRESLHEALDAGQLLRSNLADIDVQLADVRNQLAERALARDIALARAQAALLEVETLIAHAEVRSPAAGRIESLLAKPGAVVQAGQLIAQIVPAGAPRSIVAFLPASETAFIAVGTSARVELESLPVSEFGMAQATVRRISADIADPQEQAAAFGQATPGATVRVELEIDSASDKMTPHLRSGERVIVRLHRRERRIISLMFEFARTLLEQ